MSNPEQKLKVLFLCAGNSCPSLMAEGWARALKSDVIEAYSAGIETHGLNPRAVEVMAEAKRRHWDTTAGYAATFGRLSNSFPKHWRN